MTRKREKIRVGAAQISPHFFDKERTLEKTCQYILEAGKMGLDLVVFPEVYKMIRSAIKWNGEEAAQMAEAAKKAKVNCVIGCNELSEQPGSLTIFNSLIVISREGKVLGRHRKLMPTHSERVYWGMGDASDIRTFQLDIGIVGASICYEHHMTLLRAAMAIKGEEIHCALWPGWWKVDRHLGAKMGDPESRTCDIESAIRQHAIENQVFVISSSWYLNEEEIPLELREVMRYNLAVGGSCIVNPAGIIIEGPVFNEETIVHTEIDFGERDLAKAYFDCVGHYSRPDLLSLRIHDEAWTPTGPKKL
jgi:amidase/nitrilase